MKTRLRVLNLILAVFLFVFAVGNVFAWFSALDRDLFLGGASAGAYFKGGKGTQEEPYTLGNYRHLYNLAWLQNTGRIPDGTYFALDPDEHGTLTMKDESGKSVIVPPIGNADNPFNSYFDGKGMIISGLVVSTNKDVLYGNAASDSYTFSNSVGMFGMTGKDSEIKNFILDNPTVEVADESKYADSSDSDPAAIGLAIGYINGKASSIGVIGGTLAVHKTGYSTLNSILGNMSDDIKNNQNVTGGGTLGTGGSGSAFGASFDVEGMLARLNNILDNKKSSTPSWRLPDIDATNTNPVPINLEKVAFSVTEESTYTGANAKEVVADNNIGYFLGNQNKIVTSKELRFVEPLTLENGVYVDKSGKSSTVPRWFYSYTTESGSYDTIAQSPAFSNNVFNPISQDEFDSLPQGILDLLEDVDTKKRFTGIRLSQTYNNVNTPTYSNDLAGWAFHGQINWMGTTYGNGFMYPHKDEKGNITYYVADENGNSTGDMLNEYGQNILFYNYTGGIYLPNNAIWFKPSRTGNIKFVMYATNLGEGFALIKITRNSATAKNPFYTDPGEGWQYGNDITFEPIIRTSLPNGVLLYYEYEVSTKDIASGNIEYMLMQYGNGGADFLYMDIGSSAESDKSDTDHADPLKAVSAIDFIYGGVTITQKDISTDNDTVIPAGSFVIENALYKETGTMISLGGNGALVYYYHRNENGDVFSVGYYGEAPVGSVDSKHTPVSGQPDVVIDKNYSPSVWVP